LFRKPIRLGLHTLPISQLYGDLFAIEVKKPNTTCVLHLEKKEVFVSSKRKLDLPIGSNDNSHCSDKVDS